MLPTFLIWALLALALAPLAYYLFALFAAWRFFRRPPPPHVDYPPPVSILKPVRGLDPEAYENFASFCRQDYPEYEILFCTTDPNDPAIPVIEQIARDFPQRPIRLLIGAEKHGPSDKVNNLARLAREARHDILVICDSDIRVASNYLHAVVDPLHDLKTGMITCLYRGITAPQIGAELEEVGATSDFFGGVMVAWMLEGVKFGLGATIATTKHRLEEIGGFEALADCFVDDFQLGNRIARRGWRIELSPHVVETHYPALSPRSFFEHRLRWMLAVRAARPASYFGLILAMGLPWAVVGTLATWSLGWPLSQAALAWLGAYAVLRLAVAWTVGVWGMKDPLPLRKPWLIFLHDLLWFPVWVAGFFRNHVVWRDQRFRLEKGRLIPIL